MLIDVAYKKWSVGKHTVSRLLHDMKFKSWWVVVWSTYNEKNVKDAVSKAFHEGDAKVKILHSVCLHWGKER